MNRLGSCSLHPLLPIIITVVFLATSALSTEQSNPAKLRPERMLESYMFNGKEATYSFLLQPGSQLSLDVIIPDNGKELKIDLESYPYKTISCQLAANSAKDGQTTYQESFYFEKQTTATKLPGQIGNVRINCQNRAGPEARIIVRMSQGYPGEVILVLASIGMLILATVAVLFSRRKRRNRQRTDDQPVQVRYRDMWELESHEIIDMWFPEARFEQFTSDFEQKTCTICMEEMKKEQICRQLDCQHIFHTQCAKQWLEKQSQTTKNACCPNCNKQVNMLNLKEHPKASE